MRKFIRPIFLFAIAGLMAFAGSGCSKAAKTARYLAAADKYFTAKDYDKAEIEYQNVLQIDHFNPQAIGHLGKIYLEEGRTARAVAFIRQGAQMQPEDLDLRLLLGQLAMATGNVQGAREQADYILSHRPQDPEAPMLLCATITKPDEIPAIRAQLLALPAPAPASAPVLVALGMLELTQQHFKEAEAFCEQAQKADPKFAAAYSVLGAIHLEQKDLVAAEQAYKQAAEASPVRSPRRLQYAQFKLRTGDPTAGKKLLIEMTQAAPDYLPAWIALAETALAEKKYDECGGYLDKVLARDLDNLEARLLRGRLYLAQGENGKAIQELERLTTNYPKLPTAHYELGRAYAAAGDMGKALASENQAVILAPGRADAVLFQAELNLRKGDFSAIVVALKPRLQQHPDMVQAWLLLAAAFRGQGNYEDALAIYRALQTRLPQNPSPPLLLGQTLLQQKKLPEARKAYERALELAPDNPIVLEQLVDFDLLEKKYPEARARIRAQLAGHPSLAGYSQLLEAKVFLAQNDAADAETALKKAIELMPESQNAYFLLARLYATTNQQQKALASLEQSTARDPKDIRAFMLIAVINDQLKNYPAARAAYEKVLALNPDHLGALNNLAYLYSERFDLPAKALDLAQKARELLPTDPNIADTLGWILYKQHQYPRALSLLMESVAKLPAAAEVYYHLGMTHYMLGQEDAAGDALQHAVELDKSFPGADEARSRLALLSFDTMSAQAQATLEKALESHPDDPVVLVRVASVYDRAGKKDQAIKAYLAALQASPTNLKAALGLTQAYLAQNDTTRALEMAKNARKFAPDDPEVAWTLGRLAYQLGEYQWAASLLQEAVQKKSATPDLFFDQALALYSIGNVSDAEAALHSALQGGTIFLRSAEANRMLGLIALTNDPDEAVKQSAQVEGLLKADPAYVPALMASGLIKEQQHDSGSAMQCYESVLAKYPDFVPAKRRLAILGASARGEFDQKTFDRALQARLVYPADAELAKALGILTYRKGDFSRALALLKESAVGRGSDAELWYYLGQAQVQSKDLPNGRISLQKSLALGLPADLSDQAKKALAEAK